MRGKLKSERQRTEVGRMQQVVCCSEANYLLIVLFFSSILPTHDMHQVRRNLKKTQLPLKILQIKLMKFE